MRGGNGAKDTTNRECNAAKNKKAKGSQIDSNQSAMNIICNICRATFMCTMKKPPCASTLRASIPSINSPTASLILPSPTSRHISKRYPHTPYPNVTLLRMYISVRIASLALGNLSVRVKTICLRSQPSPPASSAWNTKDTRGNEKR
ncbi:hypothetical protein BWQ96_10924 [Gracilariopsis chorda]|uniref:Uncharacterized protein n=1 Tax=Gracilariopsis chorda TaxID=448386 RepID=A0A2V3IB52_9FLOR|nr:hypothetical protein BWQ96_10924 [Gracilariopsis chorda]|eukprot:PXF39392.1 hypothetical protein BWQ96_10924 [Gracilariopsis chorda]